MWLVSVRACMGVHERFPTAAPGELAYERDGRPARLADKPVYDEQLHDDLREEWGLGARP